MTTKKPESESLEMVDLGGQSYAAGQDFRLMCCGSAGTSGGIPWISAAEIVYEFTKQPGSVVRNVISFNLEGNERIELNLLDGSFELFQRGRSTGKKGRKGIDLLIQWKGMSFEEAIDYIRTNYSEEHAESMGADYQRMQAT